MREWTTEQWSLLRRRGRKRYILTNAVVDLALAGVLCWAIFLFLIPVYYERRAVPDTGYLGSGEFWALTLSAVVLFPLAGYIRGAWLWWRNERRFASQQPHDEDGGGT